MRTWWAVPTPQAPPATVSCTPPYAQVEVSAQIHDDTAEEERLTAGSSDKSEAGGVQPYLDYEGDWAQRRLGERLGETDYEEGVVGKETRPA